MQVTINGLDIMVVCGNAQMESMLVLTFAGHARQSQGQGPIHRPAHSLDDTGHFR